MATQDRAGNAYGSPAQAKTNAQRAGRVPTQSESDQHTIAHADGFIGPRISEIYGKTGSMEPKQVVPYQTKDGRQYLQQDPGFTTSGLTADRMAHLDKTVGHVKPRMFQHKGTGTIVEQWHNYKGQPKTNQFGTAASGASVNIRNDSSLSGEAHTRGIGDDLNPKDYTDITDTVRGTQSYKNSKNR